MNFATIFYFNSFIFGRRLSIKSRNRFIVGLKLMFVMVLSSIIGLFFIQRFFKFFSFLSINAYFWSSICCLVKLSWDWQVQLRKIMENAHRWEQSVYGYSNCFSYIVYAFWAKTQLTRKISIDFFLVFAYVCLYLLSYAIYLITTGLHCFPRTYNSIYLKTSMYSCYVLMTLKMN